MSNFMWHTCVDIYNEDDWLDCIEVDFRMSRAEIAGYIESTFEPNDEEILSYNVVQVFEYVCPLTGAAEVGGDEDIVPWSAVYAQLEAGGFVWSDEDDAWVYAPGE